MSKKPNKKPRITNVKTLPNTGIFHIESLEVGFNNGENRLYHRLNPKGSGAVLIVPIFDDNKVGLIYEFCGGTEQYELALPKGKIDEGEDMLAAANRELQEEIGFAAKNLVYLKTVTLAPNYQSSLTHIIMAKDLYPSKLEGDEPEELVLTYKNLDDLDDWVEDLDLTEARSIAALYLVKKKLQNY